MITILTILWTMLITSWFAYYIIKKDIIAFYFRIKHGDVEHRRWLKEEFQDHFGFVIEDKND